MKYLNLVAKTLGAILATLIIFVAISGLLGNDIILQKLLSATAIGAIKYESTEQFDNLIEKIDPKTVKLTFVGDIMLDRGVRGSVNKNFGGDYAKLFENIPDLKSGDILFGNLEGDVSDKGKNVGSEYSFRMDPVVIPVLKEKGFDVLSFANNHVGDWGLSAFNDTMDRLDQSGIKFVGAGRNTYDAQTPKIFEKDGTRIGFIGFTDVGPNWLAVSNDRSGVNLAGDENLSKIIENAKSQVDILVVSFHWGEEYKTHTKRQEMLAHTAIDNGATLVIGHHPHVMQDIEKYNEGLIVYSLGNFIFDQYFSEETMKGMVFDVTLKNGKIDNAGARVVKLTKQYQPEGIYEDPSIIVPSFGEESSAVLGDFFSNINNTFNNKKITIGFVGDIVPGENSSPEVFTNLEKFLSSPDIMIGNLEGTLLYDPANSISPKCYDKIDKCYAFAGHTTFAENLSSAGFDVLNIANNHSNDFGHDGILSTISALAGQNLISSGTKNTVTYVERNGIKIGIVGFSSYYWTSSLENENEISNLIKDARANSQIVIVVFHGGAEGISYMHTPYETEYYLGENRGNLRKFTHTAIDLGADVVLGSGPHVLRGMEWYKNKLIAYSLGNFAGAEGLSKQDFLKNSAMLNISFDENGNIVGGNLLPVLINEHGNPEIDKENTAISLVNLLSRQDFQDSAVKFSNKGKLE